MKERDDSRQAASSAMSNAYLKDQACSQAPSTPDDAGLSSLLPQEGEPSSSQAHTKPSPAPSHRNQLPDFTKLCSPQEQPLFFSSLPWGQTVPVLVSPDTPRMLAPPRMSCFTAQATKPAAFPDTSCLWSTRSHYSALFSLSTCCALYQL